jgi:uncharacterized protein YhfF
MLEKSPRTEALWREFQVQSGIDAADYVVVAFGDSPRLATELADLAAAGTKRATASLLRDYADGPEPLPRVGDFVVVVDGADAPRFIWRTTEIEIKPLIAVDDRFAFDEGEGDRTRDCWLNAHREHFRRQAARDGFAMHDRIDTVFERFEVVWPLSLADRSRAPAGPGS